MTTIKTTDSPKQLHEALCAAEIGLIGPHQDVLTRLLKAVEQLRPLGHDGKHGDLHTDECGCLDKPFQPAVREKALDTAKSLVSGQRATDYGDAKESFTRIAAIWTAILDTPITAGQAALMLAGLKMARLVQTIDHEDSWVDLAGYAALGAEVSS
jgi:hypothetical protein